MSDPQDLQVTTQKRKSVKPRSGHCPPRLQDLAILGNRAGFQAKGDDSVSGRNVQSPAYDLWPSEHHLPPVALHWGLNRGPAAGRG